MSYKTCSLCNKTKPDTDFYRRNKDSDKRSSYCIDCKKEKATAWKLLNPQKNLEYVKKYYNKNKRAVNAKQKERRVEERRSVLEHYGGRCECCGETKYEFLAIDHIEGNGKKHRQEINQNITRWIVKNNFPKGFRILCHNCNQSLGIYGYCPHKK